MLSLPTKWTVCAFVLIFYSQLNRLRKLPRTAKKHYGIRSTHNARSTVASMFSAHLVHNDLCHLVEDRDRCCQLIVLVVKEQVFSENSMLYDSETDKIIEMIVISDQSFLLQLVEFAENIINTPLQLNAMPVSAFHLQPGILLAIRETH